MKLIQRKCIKCQNYIELVKENEENEIILLSGNYNDEIKSKITAYLKALEDNNIKYTIIIRNFYCARCYDYITK